LCGIREKFRANREFNRWIVSVHFSQACFAPAGRDLFSLAFLQVRRTHSDAMPHGVGRCHGGGVNLAESARRLRGFRPAQRLGEATKAMTKSLKAFGNWRAKFKAEPQLPARKPADAPLVSAARSESRSSLRPWPLPFIFLPFFIGSGRRSVAQATHFDLLIVQILLSLEPSASTQRDASTLT
jgi:hypothetical protein